MNISVERFLDHLTLERGLSPKTRAAYRSDLESFERTARRLGKAVPDGVDRSTVLDFLAAERVRGLADASLARRVAALKSFFGYLRSEGLVAEDPTELLETPTQWRNLPDTLEIGEVERLLETPRGGSRESLRDRAILELLYACGLRVSELVNLSVEDIQIGERMLRALGKGRKMRMVPVGARALDAVRQYLAHARPAYLVAGGERSLFLTRLGRPLTREAVWRLVARRAREAGLTKALSPHTLRHSFAGHLLANGAPVRVIQELLGHADVATTQRYTHVDRERLLAEHRRYHPRA